MFRLLRSRRVRILTGLIVAYLLIMIFGGLADRLILFPSTDPIDAAGARRVMVPWWDGELEIWTARSRGTRSREPEAFVLEFTGNATRAEWIASYAAQRWADRPVEVWVMNYPGYGGSTGPAQLRSIAPAAMAAYDALAEAAGERPILLAGNSIGTAPALHVAAHRPVAGLILQNPPPLRDLVLRRFGWWNLWLIAGPIAMQIPPELNGVGYARRVRAPAVFILSERDEIVPPKYQRMIVDAHAGPKRLIHLRDADHNSPVEGPAVAELDEAMDWLLAGSDRTAARE